MHGGTLTGRSEGLGHGSQFVVRLPALAEAPAREEPREQQKDAVQAPARRILVATTTATAPTRSRACSALRP